MEIKARINKEVADFYNWNGVWPNELWLGRDEKLQLEDYFNNHESISLASGPVILNERSSISLEGLKLRFKNQDNYFKMYYNPHY